MSHLKPSGQQWRSSLQQTAFFNGQQPCTPFGRIQQVESGAQILCLLHLILTDTFLVFADSIGLESNLLSNSTEMNPLLHLPLAKSHLYPWGLYLKKISK